MPVGEKGEIAWRAINPPEYALGLELGYLPVDRTMMEGHYAIMGNTPASFQIDWKGYPMFEIDMEGLSYSKSANKQWDQPGFDNIAITQDIPIGQVLPYDSDLGMWDKGEIIPRRVKRNYHEWQNRFDTPGFWSSSEEEYNAPAPKQTKVKFPRAKADKIIKKVEKHIKPFVDRQLACGSYRRGAQMVGDIDFVIIPKQGVTLPQMLPPNDGINWVGDNKAQVIIDGEKVDFKVTTPDAWGATILYFTGPADFNIKYRWMAKKRGMKLNEYGLWDRTTDAYIAGATEQDIYDALKRPFRDPDQRKGWKAESEDDYDTESYRPEHEAFFEELKKDYDYEYRDYPQYSWEAAAHIFNSKDGNTEAIFKQLTDADLDIGEEPQDTYMILDWLESKNKRQGNAMKMMSAIIKAADKTGTTLFLDCGYHDLSERPDDIPLDKLCEWYETYGFVEGGYPRMMVRKPHRKQWSQLPRKAESNYIDYDNWHEDREAETFGTENQWIVNNLTMLLTQRARTLKELIDELGIRGITVESNLVRNSTFVRVGKHVPAVWGLNDQDYSVRHPYNAISPSAGRKQHLKTMFEKLDPREKDWDDDVTWNQKSDEPDWSDDVVWDAEYEVISLQDMDDFLKRRRFKPVDMYYGRKPVKEWVYERKLPAHANHFIRVYTSINRYGRKTDQSRDVGKDAIRVQVIYRDDKGETLVSMPKRVNRISTWRKNLDDRLTEIAQTLPTVTMDSRGEPMTLRKKKGSLFWGSRDYPAFKETRRYGAEQDDLSAGLLVEDQYNHIDDPETMQYIYDNFVGNQRLPHSSNKAEAVMFGHDFQEKIGNMMEEFNHGFLMSGRKKSDIWLLIPIYEDNEVVDIIALRENMGVLALEDSHPLTDIFDAVSGEDPLYYYEPLKRSIWQALTGELDGIYKDAINYNTIGNSIAETSFRSEEVMGDDYLINIMITEYLFKTTKNYDVHDIMKKAMNNIDLPTYKFIRGMSRHFAGDFDLVPQGSTLIPEDFINYAEVSTMEHWGNLMTRGVDNKRLMHLLRLIISDEFWFNPSYREKYEQWLTRSAINYQNI